MNKEISYYHSPVGVLKISCKNNFLIGLKKCDEPCILQTLSIFSQNIHQQLNEYFLGERKIFHIPMKINGTEFQIKIWEALQTIQYGETRTYKDIAIKINNPKSCRAVGLANNKNPINIIIPCHRVIGSSGKLIGYAGGMQMKQYLLDLEKHQR